MWVLGTEAHIDTRRSLESSLGRMDTPSVAVPPSVEYRVVDPTTGYVGLHVPLTTTDDLVAAVAEAATAYRQWRITPVAARAEIVGRIARLHRDRRHQLADIIVREMGKPRTQAVGEVEFSADIYDYYAQNAEKFLADEPLPLRTSEGTALIRRAPVGVLLGIMPWNYPYYQVARVAGPNLCAGNTVLLKHAPQCPQSAQAIATLFRDAGTPAGVYRDVYLTNDQVAEVIADPRIAGVSLTGSERAGAAVAEVAGRNLKKVVLELGGSDPFILLSTHDLDATVTDAVNARLDNTGQSCNAAKRFIVLDPLYDAFVAKLSVAMSAVTAANPFAEDTALGALSSTAAADRLETQLATARAEGATVVIGGERHGNAFAPVVLTNIPHDSRTASDEFFGPVAQVYRARDEQEAIQLANATPFGLGSYLYTTDPEQAQRVANEIDAGMVYINQVLADGVELPFGGVKRSGFGRELGRYGIEEFLNKKLIRIR